MDTFPSSWSFATLGKLFDELGVVSNSKYRASGVNTVKALVELGLTLPKNDLNCAFKNDENVIKSTINECKLTESFLNLTVGRHVNFKGFYNKVFGKRICNGGKCTYADIARLIISWLSSYILLNVYGEFLFFNFIISLIVLLTTTNVYFYICSGTS